MRILKKQNGISVIGWLLLLGLIIAVSIPAMKIIPIYLNDMKIHNALGNLENDLASQVNFTTPEKIKRDLLSRFALQQMPEITADEITVTQSNDKYTVRITHQYRERIIKDKYFTLNIDKSVNIPATVFKDR